MALNYSDILNRQPELSYVPPQNFYMIMEKLPQVVFNLQQVTIPPVNGGEATLDNRYNPTRTFIPGDGVDYGTLSCTFILDKEFRTYRTVLEWLKAINYPEGSEQYNAWLEKTRNEFTEQTLGFAATMSNITIIGSNAANEPLVHWNFVNAFPISVDGPAYDATQQDIEYLTSTVDFRFHYFEHQTYTSGRVNNDKL